MKNQIIKIKNQKYSILIEKTLLAEYPKNKTNMSKIKKYSANNR